MLMICQKVFAYIQYATEIDYDDIKLSDIQWVTKNRLKLNKFFNGRRFNKKNTKKQV